MNGYKHYFRKPKSEIAKDILEILLLSGIIVIAATSPFFVRNILRGFKKFKKYPKKKVYDTFYTLKEQGYISFYEKNNQIYFSLTEKGRQRTSWLRKLDDLKIKKPKKWDGRWRILLFDISELKRLYRESLRGKLIGMGFVMLQKSVWIIPYDCTKEIGLLKSFFGLSDKEIRVLTVESIGEDREYKKYFKLG